MNKKLKTMICGSLLVACASSASAGLISDYTLDTSTNVVTDSANGIEWLQWSVTDSVSINSALDTYSPDGWALATTTQIAGLFNTFDLAYGTFLWDEDPVTSQFALFPSDGAVESADDRELQFIALFGNTASDDGPAFVNAQQSSAYFADENFPGSYGSAFVKDDAFDPFLNFYDDSFSSLTSFFVDPDSEFTDYGIALVRDSNVATVSEPSTIALLSLGFAGLLFARRKQTS